MKEGDPEEKEVAPARVPAWVGRRLATRMALLVRCIMIVLVSVVPYFIAQVYWVVVWECLTTDA
jgi:hypothetical protein